MIQRWKRPSRRKSQLAIEYTHRLRQTSRETWVLWIYASNPARFEQSVRNTLDQLRVRGRKDPRANIFQLLHDWLCDSRSRPWLLVLDNADDARVLLGKPPVCERAGDSAASDQHEKTLLEYLPQCDHGKILVTSRSKEAAKELVDWKDIVAVEPMEAEQALSLLEKKLDQAYEVRDVIALARALDCMPLAMAQAAAYICQRAGRCSVQEYVEKLGRCDKSETSVLDVNERDLRRDREANNSIMLTWQISFNHIREVRRSAADLLALMSFFDRQAIPEALLQEKGSCQVEDQDEGSRANGKAGEGSGEDVGGGALGERNAKVPVDKTEEYEKDIVVLRNYNLVSCTTDRTTFEMHRLVQLATRKWLKANSQLERWGSQFISNLNDAFPAGNFENWESCRSLFPHATAALHTEVTGREAVLRKASLLIRSAEYASSTGAYADAKKMEERSLQARRNVLGEGHPDTLTSMGNLAGTYSKQGRWEEAEKLQVEVMEKRKEVLGEGHPYTLTSMNNLAMTYLKQGRWEEAEKVQVEVMEKSKEVLGEGHPSTLTSMNNLAMTYLKQGRWEKAERLQVEVTEKRKEVLGEGHPSTLTSMNNLSGTYSQRGLWDEAEKLQVEVMGKRKEVLGEGHPDTLTSIGNLAATYSDQGRWEEAEKLQVEVMEKSKEALGEGHPDTLGSMNNLAMTYLKQGRWEEAEKLEVEVMENREEVLGEGHLDTLTSMSNLADTYSQRGQ
jgi:tetratricopeptide (TPR) repeat protein